MKALNIRNVHVTSPRLSEDCIKSHTKMWKLERILAVLLVGVLPTAFMFPSKTMDVVLVSVAVFHSYLSLEAVADDYLQRKYVGSFLKKIGHIAIFAFSLLSLWGLMTLIMNEVGVVKPIRKLWSYEGHKEVEDTTTTDCSENTEPKPEQSNEAKAPENDQPVEEKDKDCKNK